jgi:predicted transcriptional regulator
VAAVSATSLKLPERLKRRLARLAATAGQSTHAYMVEALAREAERAELRERFAADASEAEAEALATGKAHPIDEAFGYLSTRAAHAAGTAPATPRRPRPRSWRAAASATLQSTAGCPGKTWC